MKVWERDKSSLPGKEREWHEGERKTEDKKKRSQKRTRTQ